MLEAKYLDEAIAQNLGETSPDAWTCIRLAAQMYLRDRLYSPPEAPARPELPQASAYALADSPRQPSPEIVAFPGKSDFARAIDGKDAADIWPVMDDVMSIFATLHRDLYDNAMRIIRSK